MPARKPRGCDLVHRVRRLIAVKLLNGPENLLNLARPSRRSHRRLRLDRDRDRLGPDRVDLSHPGLINR